jgi:hypothetical protein
MKVTEEQIVRDDQPGFEIALDASELGCPPGQVPPKQVKLTVPSGDQVELERLGEVVNSEGELQYWSYFNEWPADPIQLKVFND